MRLYLSNNFKNWLFYSLIILHFIVVGVFFAHGAYSIESLQNIKDLQLFGSRGIYLYLVFWMTLFLWMFYKRESNHLFKNYSLGIVLLLVSGVVGIPFHTNQKPNPVVFLSEDNFPCLSYEKLDHFQASVKFKEFSPEFLKWLKRSENGEAKAFLRIYLMPLRMQVSIKEKMLHSYSDKFILSQADIGNFLNSRELILTPLKEESHKKNCDIQLLIRDTQSVPKSREDFFIYEGKKHQPSKDGAFMVVFYFESKDGLPLALFY